MKKIWMLTVLFAFAGCQPDVPESPVAHPAKVEKTELPKEAIANSPDSQVAPEKAVAAPQKVVPVHPKPAPKIIAAKTEATTLPPVDNPQVVKPAKTEEPVVAEPSAGMPALKLQLSEAEAMALAKKKNCFACHALEKKVVGPAWRMVAEKYRGDAGAQATLEIKVRKGGKGVWGSVAMPPQSALSEEELKGLVQFVLQLK